MNLDFKTLAQSKWWKRGIAGLGIVVAAVVVFKAGEFVGFKKASFSYRVGEKYFRAFAGPERGTPGIMMMKGGDFLMGHGIFGSVISVSSSSIVMQGEGGLEQTVGVSSSTIIMRFKDRIALEELKDGDRIVVIGAPDEEGRIDAKLIRVVPEPFQTFNMPVDRDSMRPEKGMRVRIFRNS